MSQNFSLATQIAEVKRELGERPGVYQRARVKDGALKIAIMESVLHTLEWLQANEDKIKAKVETADTLGTIEPVTDEIAPSTRVYRQRIKMFLDFPKGGWSRLYDIVDDADKVIGTKEVGAETRTAKERIEFVPIGFRTFDTAAAFIAAYERGEWSV